MTKEESYEDTRNFLKTIDEKGLYHYNEKYFDKDFFKNFMKFEQAFSHTYVELGKKAKEFETSQEEVMIFFIYTELSYVISHLETTNKFLKMLVNPDLLKDGFDEDTTLGTMIYKICKKLGYDKKLWKLTFDLFYINFRNAFAHQNYLISEHGLTIYHKDKEKKQDYTIEQLGESSIEIEGVLLALQDFIKSKSDELDLKSDELDRKTTELKKQKEELDRKIQSLS